MNSYDDNEFANAWSSGPSNNKTDNNATASSTSNSNNSTSSSPAPEAAANLQETLAKERIIKDILQLRDGLRGLMVRVTEVEGETDKLRKDNEFLGTYIDNL